VSRSQCRQGCPSLIRSGKSGLAAKGVPNEFNTSLSDKEHQGGDSPIKYLPNAIKSSGNCFECSAALFGSHPPAVMNLVFPPLFFSTISLNGCTLSLSSSPEGLVWVGFPHALKGGERGETDGELVGWVDRGEGLHDFEGESHAVLDGASVLVGSLAVNREA
jgi:hypothetical protein